jgi:hypothetical protein
MLSFRAHNQWLGLALGLVLAFFGHDILMAADMHARQAVVPESAHHAVMVHTTPMDVEAVSIAATHPDGCAPVWPMVSPPGDRAPRSGAALVPAFVLAEGWISSAPEWRQPTSPPSVRRALFQVYRM